ncbi:hypothetical protein C8R45DRAFT_1008414 [Mycena sanguinolenta]|nr:hypothetical protein C8R45DRAFT_1008414 [Mycena sanguinolenta]
MSDDHRNFDLATNWHDSTALPNPTNTTAFYPPFHGGFPADTAPWEPDQFVQTWSPNAVGTTVGPAEQARGQEARPKSPCVVSVDGVDAVSAAFLQLVEFHERNQLDTSSFDLLRFSLKNGYLAPDDLLAVVDWKRLQNLAFKDGFPSPVQSIDPNNLQGYELPNLVTSNRPTIPSDFSRSNHSYALWTPWPETLPPPAVQSIEPRVHPLAEYEQSSSQTLNPGAIMDTSGVSGRRCLNCGADHTTQWRRHPETPGFLCNACWQHQSKYGTARSPQWIIGMRGTRSAKANHEDTGAMPTRPNHPPETRGGDVIMRVRVQKP